MNKRIPIVLGIIMVFIAIWCLITPMKPVRTIIERLDNLGYDLQLRTRVLTETVKPLSPVAIVDIDDKSIKAEGRWPWPRSKIAQLVDELQKDGAAIIAFDIFFSEKESNIAETVLTKLNTIQVLHPHVISTLTNNRAVFDEDTALAKSIAKTQSALAIGFLPRPDASNALPPPVLTLTKKELEQLELIQARGYISNIPILQEASKGSGFINIFPDSDGIVRRAPLLMVYKNGVYPALALQAVMLFLDDKIKLVTPSYNTTRKLEAIRLGEHHVIPTNERGEVLIPFIGKSYTFPYYSATDILHGNIAKNALAGKILFVGTSATGLGDLHAMAIESPFPGVEVQATLVNGMLQHGFSYKPAWTLGANIFLTLFLGLIAAFVFPYLGPRALALIILFLPPALLFLNNWLWDSTGLILSFLVPVILVLVTAIGNMVYGYLFETRRREHLKAMFGQYVPEKHIDEMLKTKSDYGLRGEDREMTVLFADIRDFTAISETLSAADLVDMLNTFFTPMTEIIFKHRGTIDKYIGDLIMAFWGAPLKDKYHARRALESALEMQAKLKSMREEFTNRKFPHIKLGIGINSGVMSVGDMGSRFRRNYTVLGDAVNLGSRVESLTKFYGVDIIATETTQENQTRFVFRKLDQVRVKGKNKSISLYELICLQINLTPDLDHELKQYHEALSLYFQQKWDEAETILTELQKAHPDARIYQIYLDRIKEFKVHPLPRDWDGVYVHTAK